MHVVQVREHPVFDVGGGELAAELYDVQHPDDVHEAGVLEQSDELAHDGRDDVADGLRQRDQQGRLPAGKAQGAGSLGLARVQRLQTSPNVFRRVGRAEQGDDDGRAEQRVKREVLGECQRHQDLRHEQQRDQGNAAKDLDEHNAQQLDHGKPAAAPQGQRNSYGEADDDAGHRQQEVQHQPAPVQRGDRLQPGNSRKPPKEHQCQQESYNGKDRNPAPGAQRRVACQRPTQ